MSRLLRIHTVLVFFISSFVFGQEEFIEGKLVDSESDEPVVFATIRLKSKALGVISNMDGSFQIPSEFRTQGDTVRISSMGYASKEILLRSLEPDKVNRISLKPAIEILDEVVVSGKRSPKNNRGNGFGLSANEIVIAAIKNIQTNYCRLPYSYVGYYRDYQLNDSLYINLNEALMEVFDRGFGTIDYDATKTRIYEYKRNTDFQIDTVAEKPYDYKNRSKTIDGASMNDFDGNEFLILRVHDAIRNHRINSFDYVNVFDVDFTKNHTFKRAPDIILDNEKLFVISVDKKAGNNRVAGKLYVSQHNFAIHKMEYALYRGGKNVQVNDLYRHSRSAEDKFFEVQLEYKPLDGIMYLNYISVSNDFRVRRDPIFKVNSISMNWNVGCYEVHFSTPPKVSEAMNPKKYSLRFKGRKVKIDNVEVKNETVRLFTRLDGVKAHVDEIKWKLQINESTGLKLKVKNLKDINGNRIDQNNWLKATQFREFFVQQIKPKSTPPNDYLYMKKDRPIFKGQPIVRPDNFGDYWMNTPLRKMEE